MVTMTYVELRAHSCFSFSDGAVSAENLARRARELGYTHLGITDTADLGGIARFANEALTEGLAEVKPIVGAELIVDGHPAAFLARTPEGYQNLSALVTMARVGQWDGWKKETQSKQRGRPRVTWAQVAAHSKDLHALTGPATGDVASLLRAGREAEASRRIRRWREVFPDGSLSIEVQLHHAGGHEAALAAVLIELAESEGLPWVATQDPRYVDERGRLVHDMLTALRYNLTIDQAAERGLLHPNGEWRLLSPQAMAAKWRGREEGLRETLRVAERCEGFMLDWMRPPLPDFRKAKLSVGMSHMNDNEALRVWTDEGMRERWGETSREQRDQIDHELKMIAELGFAGFFLVMADAVRFARRKNILCQGRGSAANSAVAFCLGITAVDPVANGLLFERFLSPARVDGRTEPPDIDVDFEHDRREEVLDYMYEKYDRAHAAITAVTQCFHAPTAVQDAMRALGYPPEQALEISKRVHHARAGGVRGRHAGRSPTRAASTSAVRADGRCCYALPGFEGLRAPALDARRRLRRSRPRRSATFCPSNRRRWGARSCSSTRTIST